jgi:hypothetical protein
MLNLFSYEFTFSRLQICFVGEENYYRGCTTDPDAEKKFYKGMENRPKDANKYLIGEDESNKQRESE